jgi:hypothetical protein
MNKSQEELLKKQELRIINLYSLEEMIGQMLLIKILDMEIFRIHQY